MKKYFLLICFLICGNLFSRTDSIVKKNYASYVIIPSTQENIKLSGNVKSTLWTPDSALIEAAFLKLPAFIESIKTSNDTIYNDQKEYKSYKTYNYQILGMKNRDGDRIICLNGYYNPDCVKEADWKTKFFFFNQNQDNCMVRLCYDVDNKRWYGRVALYCPDK